MKNRRRCHIFISAILVALGYHGLAAGAQTVPASNCPRWSEIKVDDVWAGVKVDFDGVQDNQNIYLGYYDSERNFVVAKIDKCSGKKATVKLPSVFNGWDAHNYITLALDKDGNLHVVGNMHAAPLVYARTSVPGRLSDLLALRPMIGADESSVTYPYFFKFQNGDLGFSYRDGRSGQGSEQINRFVEGVWQRTTNQPIFAAGRDGDVSAYHTRYFPGRDGYFHVAWVWRRNPNVETNFDVNYAKSRDLKNWFRSDGTPINLPITPETSEVVDAVPMGSGLLNNIQISEDSSGRIIISYIKFDENGFSQIWTSRLEDGKWHVRQSTHYSFRWDVRGGGTVLPEISYGPLAVTGDVLAQNIRFPRVGNVVLRYAERDLEVLDATVLNSTTRSPVQSPIRDGRLSLRKDVKGNSATKYQITWRAYPEDNRDLQRKCDASNGGCNLKSSLLLDVVNGK